MESGNVKATYTLSTNCYKCTLPYSSENKTHPLVFDNTSQELTSTFDEIVIQRTTG